MGNPDTVVKNAETLYVYTSGGFGFAYFGSPVKLWPLTDVSAELHDNECKLTGCDCTL